MQKENTIYYSAFAGFPSGKLLEEFLELDGELFDEPFSESYFKNKLGDKSDILSLVAYSNTKPIGFKIGYAKSDKTYYSWLGGVLPSFRKKGVASALMRMQHEQVKHMGYIEISTKTFNHFKLMLILNLKHGFDITGTHQHEKWGLQILLHKKL